MEARYEGYLFLKEAQRSPLQGLAANSQQHDKSFGQSEPHVPGSTSISDAWTERWCSLEGGKLLVYPDSLAAIVRPEAVCCSFDMSQYQQIRTSSSYGVDSQNVCELTLIGAPPLRFGSQGLPKSTTLAHLGQQADRVFLRRRSSDLYSAAPTVPKSFSKATSPTTIQECRTGAIVEESSLRDKCSAEKSKTWSKLTSRSRRLYKLVSGGSSNSLYDHYQASHKASPVNLPPRNEGPSPTSDTMSTSSFASTGVSSPTTPGSYSFQEPDVGPPIVTFRASSAAALNKWAEAMSLSIRSKPNGDDALQDITSKRLASRTPLAGIYAGWEASLFPVSIPEANSLMTEAAAQSRRRREESFSSLRQGWDAPAGATFTLPASDLFRRRQQKERNHGGDLGDIVQGGGRNDNSRPSTASAASRSASVSRSSGRRSRSRPVSFVELSAHERTVSIASAGTETATLSSSDSMRRASTSILLDVASQSQKGDGGHETGCAAAIQVMPEPIQIREATRGSVDKRSFARHRRSGSLMSRSSIKVAGWRETAPNESSPHHTLACGVGLGLALLGAEPKRDQTAGSGPVLRERKGLAKLKSFGMRPSSRASKRGSIPDFGPCAQGAEGSAMIPTQMTSQGKVTSEDSHLQASTTKSASHRGIPRASSLLSMSKLGVGPRDKASVDGTEACRAGSTMSRRSPLLSSHPDLIDDDISQNDRQEPRGCPDPDAYGREAPTLSTAPRPKEQANDPVLAVKGKESRPIFSKADHRKRALTPSPKVAMLTLDEHAVNKAQPSATPPVVERILPPEELIATFDRLREAEDTSFGSIPQSRSEMFTKMAPDSSTYSLGHSTGAVERSVLPLPVRPSPSRIQNHSQEAAVVAREGRSPFCQTSEVPRPAVDISPRLPVSASARNFGELADGGASTFKSHTLNRRAMSPFQRLDSDRELGSYLNRSLPAPPRAAKRIKDASARTGDESADMSLEREPVAPGTRKRFTSTAFLNSSGSASSQLTSRGTEAGISAAGSSDSQGDASFSSGVSLRPLLPHERPVTRIKPQNHSRSASLVDFEGRDPWTVTRSSSIVANAAGWAGSFDENMPPTALEPGKRLSSSQKLQNRRRSSHNLESHLASLSLSSSSRRFGVAVDSN